MAITDRRSGTASPTTLSQRRDGVTTGLAVKRPVRAATTANITLAGLQTIDGVALAAENRVLVKNQTNGVNNGIWDASTGNWTRATDFDGALDVVSGTMVYVVSGTTLGNTFWAISTADDITIGTTSISWVQGFNVNSIMGTLPLANLTGGTAGYALIGNGAGLAPSYQGFLQSGTGAVTRTWQDKARDIVHAADWGVSAAASAAANTTALNLFFTHVRDNQAHGILPPGSIQHTGLTITGNGNSIVISGAGTRATTLMNTSTTSNDLTIDTTAAGINNLHISDILFDSLATKTAGYGIKQTGNNPIASDSVFENLFFSTKTWGGMSFRCLSNTRISNVKIFLVGTNARGIELDGAVTHTINTVQLKNICILDGNGGAGTTTTALWLGDYVSGHFSDIQIQAGTGAMTRGIHIVGSGNADCYFTRCYADVCNANMVIDGGVDLMFSQCGFINAVFAPTSEGNGVKVTGGYNITFDQCFVHGNQKRGFDITGGSSIQILNSTIANNGFVPSGGSEDGIVVANNVSNFVISNNIFFFNASPYAIQRNDIKITGPTNDYYTITGNVCHGATAGIVDSGTGVNKFVHSNPSTIANTGNFTGSNIFTRPDGAALTVLSSNAGAFAALNIGRTVNEFEFAVAGSANQFVTGTVAGEAAINTTTLWIGNGGSPRIKVGSGSVTLGAAGTLVPLIFANATSGTITLQPVTGALGTVTLSMPAATDQLVGRATTDTLTNKTLTAAVLGGTTNVSGGQLQFPAAQSASANANTLDDYEEGTWTPTGNAITFSAASGTYTKIGNKVIFDFDVTWPATADAGEARVQSLPFSSAANAACALGYTDEATVVMLTVNAGTTINVRAAAGANITNATMSGNRLIGGGTYTV